MKEYSVFCDGSVSKPKFGRAISGWVVLDEAGEEQYTGAKIVADGTELATVNVAEYSAVLLALETIKEFFQPAKISVFTDSQLVVRQLNGIYACTKSHLNELKKLVEGVERELVFRGFSVSYTWISRSENTRADALSKSMHSSDFGVKKSRKV